MKKKLIVMLLVVAMLPAMLFASSDIMQIGLNIGYRPTLDTLMNNPESDWKDYFNMDYFSFAPELKLNLFFIDLDATAQFAFMDEGTLINTEVAADLYAKLFGVVRLSAGAGLAMPFFYNKANGTWYIDETVPMDGQSFLDTVKNSRLNYRAGVGFDFGRFNMMINYSVPTSGTFMNPDFKPDWYNGQFSLGLLVDLF